MDRADQIWHITNIYALYTAVCTNQCTVQAMCTMQTSAAVQQYSAAVCSAVQCSAVQPSTGKFNTLPLHAVASHKGRRGGGSSLSLLTLAKETPIWHIHTI